MSKRTADSDVPEFTRQVPKFLRGLVEERKPKSDAESDALELAVVVNAPNSPSDHGKATETKEDWRMEFSDEFKRSFYVHVKSGRRRYTKPDVLLTQRERGMAQCAIVEVIRRLQSTWVDLDTMQVYEQEPSAFAAHRAALERLRDTAADDDDDARDVADECLRRLVVDTDGSLAKLPAAAVTVAPVPRARPEKAAPVPRARPAVANKALLSFGSDDE